MTGPIDVLDGTKAGALDRDLRTAALAALDLKREDARALALKHSWRECARIFIDEMEAAKAWTAGRNGAAAA